MKKNAIMSLIKDLVLAAIFVALGSALGSEVFRFGSASMGLGVMCAGIPFGWRWASKVIQAVSLQGIGIKLCISLVLGWFALIAILLRDVIRCFTAPSGKTAG